MADLTENLIKTNEVSPEIRISGKYNLPADEYYLGAILGVVEGTGNLVVGQNTANFRPIGRLLEQGFTLSATTRRLTLLAIGPQWIRYTSPTDALIGVEWYADGDGDVTVTRPSNNPHPGGVIRAINTDTDEVLIDFTPRT